MRFAKWDAAQRDVACQSGCGQSRGGPGLKANQKFIGVFVDIGRKVVLDQRTEIFGWMCTETHTNIYIHIYDYI